MRMQIGLLETCDLLKLKRITKAVSEPVSCVGVLIEIQLDVVVVVNAGFMWNEELQLSVSHLNPGYSPRPDISVTLLVLNLMLPRPRGLPGNNVCERRHLSHERGLEGNSVSLHAWIHGEVL